MNEVVRFWIVILSLLVSVSAVGYLFLSFLFPGTVLVIEDTVVRIVVMFVAFVAIGVFLWSTVLFDDQQPPKPRER